MRTQCGTATAKLFFVARVMLVSFASMTKRSAMVDKRRQAQRLYVHSGLLQQDLAELLGVSQKTISQWKHADGWDKQRAAVTTTKEKELARLYAQLSAQNDFIEARTDEGRAFATSHEADAINKLSAAIAKLEQDAGLSATVNVFIRFTQWLRDTGDMDTMKRFTELSNGYIQSLLRA